MMAIYAQGYDLRGAPAGLISGKPALVSEDRARGSVGMRLFLFVFGQIRLK